MSDGYRRRWETLERLFDAALDVPAESRLEWLEGLEWLDDELKEEARAMLAAHQRAEGVLERSVRSLAGEALAAREEAPGPRAGDRVGPYRVIGEAGRGGMGVVYRAHDERLERDVALKQLPARPDGFAAARRRFLREARSISSLDHPNLCTIHDLLELEDGRLFLAMAFYEGETLAEKLARGPVDPAEAVDYVLQAAAGQATAHEAGVVHRDIKPANLLVDRRGVLKILDFGVAQLGEGAPGERGGTPGYMAPEQWSGREVDRRADLWSLGVVLHELLVGERPFAAQDAESLIVAAAAGPPPLPETIAGADGMGRVLAGLLSVDPEDRPASAEEVLVRLGPYRDRRRLGRRRRPRLTAAVPEPPTPLIGREREIEWVEEALASSRLVTLTGPAGTGKTRLAIAVARRAVDRYRDGVAFVSLAALDAAELVAAEIAGQLGVGETAQRPPEESLTAALEGRRVLLVLDNFEQVVEAAALVARLLAACPGLTVLVTSRARLKLQGELARSVPPLERPRPGMDEAAGLATPAVRLFLDRARAADAAFGAEGRDVAAILAICRRLEGIPLAIELAAARVPLLGVAELSRRLERRLDLLVGSGRDRPERHRTLREAISWSLDLLTPDELGLLSGLAVCRGFDLRAAVELGAGAGLDEDAVLATLEGLIDHSLLIPEERRGERRFRMLELIREAASERSGASAAGAARRLHALHYLERAEASKGELTGPEQVRSLDRVEGDHDNYRAALEWASEARNGRVACRLAAALWRFWLVRGHLREGRSRLEGALALPTEGAGRERAEVLLGAAHIVSSLGEPLRAIALAEAALETHRRQDDTRGVAEALIALGWLACETSDLERARERSREGLELARQLGERRMEALALNNLGWVDLYRGRPRAARPRLEESLRLREAIGDERGVAYGRINLAWADLLEGELDDASRRLGAAHEMLEGLGDVLLRSWAEIHQASLAIARGEPREPLEWFERSIEEWRELDHPSGLAWAETMLAELYLAVDELDEAEAAARAARDHWRAVPTPWGEAWAERLLGRAALGLGRRDEARDFAERALATAERLDDRIGAARARRLLDDAG